MPSCSPQRFTYLIGAQDGDTVKIGRAVNPHKRARELQVGNADTLVVLALSTLPERWLHQRFSHLRMRGEWFRRDAELNAFITEAPLLIPDYRLPTRSWPPLVRGWWNH